MKSEHNEKENQVTRSNSEAATSAQISAENNVPAAHRPGLSHRQRQVDELFNLYDIVMIDRLLKGHPTLEKLIGS